MENNCWNQSRLPAKASQGKGSLAGGQEGNAVNSQFTKARPRPRANIRNKANDVVVNAADGADEDDAHDQQFQTQLWALVLANSMYVFAPTYWDVSGWGMAN